MNRGGRPRERDQPRETISKRYCCEKSMPIYIYIYMLYRRVTRASAKIPSFGIVRTIDGHSIFDICDWKENLLRAGYKPNEK